LEIDGTLESMQSLVGGYIETYPYEYEPMVFVMNEEGKLQNFKPHRFIQCVVKPLASAMGI